MTRIRFWTLFLGCGLFLTTPGLPGESYAQAQSCSPTTSMQISQFLDQSRSKIYLVKFDDAIERINAAESALPCLSEPLPRETLSRLYLYRGIASFNKGNEPEAAAYFRQAVAIDRATRWDERFGQRPREVFVEAKEAALMANKGTVKLPELKPRSLIYVDGEPAASGGSLTLAPGRHFWQLKVEDHFVRSEFLDVPAGGEVEIPVPASYREVKQAPPPPTPTVTQPVQQEPVATVKPVPETRPAPPPPEPKDRTKLRPVSYAFLGIGGAGFATFAGAGFATKKTQDALVESYYSNRDDEERDALLARQRMTAIIANAGLGLGVLAGGTGAVLFVRSRGGSDELSGLTPVLSPGLVGLNYSGSF